MDFQKGEIILINKPYGWTSFDVVNKIRNIIKKDARDSVDSELQAPKLKVGHAGTLDPLATGLLIVCTGALTKKIEIYQAQQKEYTGTFFLGATTPTYDLETSVDHKFNTHHITEETITEATHKFKGKIWQTPPIHSAVKTGGSRAYDKARKGHVFSLEPKEVEISEFVITKTELPLVHFRVTCSKGTYIRSLAHDFGKALNSGAYLAALCRTKIGTYKLEDAMDMKKFTDAFSS